MAKKLLKKAKKAVSNVEVMFEKKAKKLADDGAKKVEKVVSKSSGSPKVHNIREHIEKLASERRDCAAIWTLIKNTNQSRDEVLNLIKAKGYETLLGELS